MNTDKDLFSIDSVTIFDLLSKISDERSALEFSMKLGIIPATVSCKNGHEMKLNAREKKVDKFSWRCSCTERSVKTNSWFSWEGFTALPMSKVLLVL